MTRDIPIVPEGDLRGLPLGFVRLTEETAKLIHEWGVDAITLSFVTVKGEVIAVELHVERKFGDLPAGVVE